MVSTNDSPWVALVTEEDYSNKKLLDSVDVTAKVSICKRKPPRTTRCLILHES